MNLNTERDRTQLFKAMTLSYQKLAPFRQLNEQLVSEYAGSGYGQESGPPKFETMMNLMAQAIDAYTMSLVANRPRVTVETNRENLRFFARHFAVAINNLIQEINLEEVLRKWVVNAFFCLGVVKAHMADAGAVELWDGQRFDPGTPFASNVGMDDWVHDMSATRWDQVGFAADAYRIPFDRLGDDIFDQKIVRQLSPTTRGHGEDATGRVQMLSEGYHSDSDDVEPMIDLMDVWIPPKKIYTFAMEPSPRFQGKFAPLADFDWDGPELGPYHLLGFNDVPENIMPASPASHIRALAALANNLIRKQARQAKRQKDIHTYTPAGAQSAKKAQRGNDGDWVEVQDQSEIGVMKMGGVDAGNHAFLLHVVDVFDRMAGNLPAMLGLGPQADTLGQEQLIAGSVSKKEGQMRIKCLDATRRLISGLSYMLWTDVAKIIPGRMEVPGVPGVTIDSTWTPEHRMGDFYDYDLNIDVHSMPYQPPEAKAKTLLGVLTQVYAPLAPMLSAQGGQINLQAVTDILAEMLYMPRLKEVVQFTSPPPGETPSVSARGAPPMPSATSREYVRRSVATGGTPQGRSTTQQQAWLAVGDRSGGGMPQSAA